MKCARRRSSTIFNKSFQTNMTWAMNFKRKPHKKKGNIIRLLGIKQSYPFARWNRHDGNFPGDFTAFFKAMKAPEPWEASAAAWALGRLLDVNPAAMPDEAQVCRGWVAPRDGWNEVPSGKLTWQWKSTFSNRKYNKYIHLHYWIFHCYVTVPEFFLIMDTNDAN